MTFEQFCALHGVTLTSIPMHGRWVRMPTEDKPKHRNGAVKFLGDMGFVQNWATMTEPAVWKAEGDSHAVQKKIRETANRAAQESAALARNAAQKAQMILAECELATHPYLAAKGFPDEVVNVWNCETDNIMVVPMRRAGQIVGCQQIKPDGDKKFLYGQRSGGAEFIFGQRGTHVLCEGYATALSTQQALRNLKVQYVLHATFSAGNMKKVAENLPTGLVIADNDASGTGEKVAREIGWPYWISDAVSGNSLAK